MHFLSRQAILRELHATVALHLEADLPRIYVCFIENNAQIHSYCQRFKPYGTPRVCWYLSSTFPDSCLASSPASTLPWAPLLSGFLLGWLVGASRR